MVSTFTQPDQSTQTGSTYKEKIDGAIAVHHRMAGAFACHQNNAGSPDAADLTVRMDAGALFDGVTLTEVAAQSTAALTAPASNPRYDIVYYDRATGAIGVATGSEAASPSDPAVPSGKIPAARIRWTAGMTEITNDDLDDLRVSYSSPIFTGPGNGSPTTDGTPGLVPAPTVAQDGYVLKTNGWQPETTSDQTARDMAASALALADANGTAGPVGAFYLADPFTADTLAIKTNATYSSADDWYSNPAAYALIDRTAGSAVGNMTGAGGLTAAFDGDTTQGDAVVAKSPLSTEGKVGKNYGAGNEKLVRRAVIYPSDDFGFLNDAGSTQSITITIYGSNSGYEVSPVTLGSSTFTDKLTAETIDFSNSTAYRWIWAVIDSPSKAGSYMDCAECQFYTLSVAGDMTLRPTPATLLTANPVDVMGYFLFDPVDSVTFGVDVVGKVRIADGSPEDFVTGSWEQVGTYGNYELWRLDVDLTGKTGSTLQYAIETANSKEIRLKQCVGLVPLYSA